MRPRVPGDELPAAERALIERAWTALDVTPLAVAAAEGLDAATVARLRRGAGDRERARRLAVALRRQGAELRALAAEMLSSVSRD